MGRFAQDYRSIIKSIGRNPLVRRKRCQVPEERPQTISVSQYNYHSGNQQEYPRNIYTIRRISNVTRRIQI